MTTTKGVALLTLAASALLGLFLLGPTLSTPLRAEDFLDLDLYSRHAPWRVFVTPHLGALIVGLYRPVSDFLDALMVRAFGASAVSYHAVVLAFMIANAVLLGRLAAALWPGGGALPGLLVALLYIAHPMQQGTLSYFEGGMAHVSFLFFLLLALLAYLRLRAGGGAGAYAGFLAGLLAAMLCFDGAITLPAALVACELGALLPASPGRSLWSRLLGLVPAFALVALVLVVRRAILGTMLGGYGLTLTPPLILGFPRGFALLLARLLTPTFHCLAPELPWHVPGAFVALAVLAALLTALVLARDAARAALAALVVGVFLLGPSTLDFVNEAIARGDIEPLSSYRLNVPLAMVALAAALALCGACARLGRARIALAGLLGLALVAQHVAFAGVFRRHNDRAGVMAATIQREVERLAPPAPAPVLLIDTPLAHGPPGCGVMRVFPWGLASALRPPATSREVLVYPILEDADQLIFRPGAVEQLGRVEGVTALRYSRATDTVAPFRAAAAPPPIPRLAIVSPRNGEVVPVRDGSFTVVLAAEELHDLVIVLVNRVSPFYLAQRPPSLLLPVARTDGGFAVTVGGRYLAQIPVYFPDDPVFLYAEDLSVERPPKKPTVLARSEVLRLQLRWPREE